MKTVAAKQLGAMVEDAASLRAKAQLIISKLQPLLPEDDVPTERTVRRWLVGERIPRTAQRRALHQLGVLWGAWCVPADVDAALRMNPPSHD